MQRPGGQFSINVTRGNLFHSTCALAHCVSRDLKMSMGIAQIFRDTFCRIDQLERQNCRVGQVATLNVDGRYIYYLITKLKYNDKPTYETLRESLVDMKVKLIFSTVLCRLICNFHFFTLRFYVKTNLVIVGDMKLLFSSF